MWHRRGRLPIVYTASAGACYSFKDGSTLVGLLEGTGVSPGTQKGKLTFLRGTGRFVGVGGKADFTAVAVTSIEKGSDTYVDVEGEYYLLSAVRPPSD